MGSTAVKGAFVTAGSLFGGIFIGIIAGSIVHGIPTHLSEGTRIALASVPSTAGFVLGGAIWGSLLARDATAVSKRRMTLAGGLGFGLTVIAVALLLSLGEVLFVQEGRGPDVPIYVIYTFLFAPAAFVVSGVGAGAIGYVLAGGRRGLGIGLRSGIAGGAAFLAVNTFMEALGWQVGAPGAAARATMVTVTILGSIAAALAGGAVLGREIENHLPEIDRAKERKNSTTGDQSSRAVN
jgi:MFS family permease